MDILHSGAVDGFCLVSQLMSLARLRRERVFEQDLERCPNCAGQPHREAAVPSLHARTSGAACRITPAAKLSLRNRARATAQRRLTVP